MNGLAHITIAGQKVGLKFGLPAVKRIMEKMADHEMMVEGQYTELGITHIIYAGYANYCLMHDTAPVIPFNGFYEQIENIDEEDTKQEVIAAILAFEESKYVKRVIKANEEEKKKAMMILNQSTGTLSKPSVSESLDMDQPNIADSPGDSTSSPSGDLT